MDGDGGEQGGLKSSGLDGVGRSRCICLWGGIIIAIIASLVNNWALFFKTERPLFRVRLIDTMEAVNYDFIWNARVASSVLQFKAAIPLLNSRVNTPYSCAHRPSGSLTSRSKRGS